MSLNKALTSNKDVRAMRPWLNKLFNRVESLEKTIKPEGKASALTWPQNVQGVVVAIAVVQEDTDKVNIYKGEGDNEKLVFEGLERNKEGEEEVDDWAIRNSESVAPGDQLLAVKVRGIWECYLFGGAGAIPAKITGYSGGTYNVELYGNGTAETYTGTGEALPLNLGIAEQVPNDTWVMVHRGALNVVASE